MEGRSSPGPPSTGSRAAPVAGAAFAQTHQPQSFQVEPSIDMMGASRGLAMQAVALPSHTASELPSSPYADADYFASQRQLAGGNSAEGFRFSQPPFGDSPAAQSGGQSGWGIVQQSPESRGNSTMALSSSTRARPQEQAIFLPLDGACLPGTSTLLGLDGAATDGSRRLANKAASYPSDFQHLAAEQQPSAPFRPTLEPCEEELRSQQKRLEAYQRQSAVRGTRFLDVVGPACRALEEPALSPIEKMLSDDSNRLQQEFTSQGELRDRAVLRAQLGVLDSAALEVRADAARKALDEDSQNSCLNALARVQQQQAAAEQAAARRWVSTAMMSITAGGQRLLTQTA